jgi:hypothetical protein
METTRIWSLGRMYRFTVNYFRLNVGLVLHATRTLIVSFFFQHPEIEF